MFHMEHFRKGLKKMYDRDDLKRINRTVNIPKLLVKLGAEERNIKQLYGKPDYRCNCWFRNGDNLHGFGCTYNPKKEKYLCTDFTQRTFGNIDLIDFVSKLTNLSFGDAVKFIKSCCDGSESDLDANTLGNQNKARTGQITTLEPYILDCFFYGLHPYLQGRGYNPETAKYFELGFCNWGELIDRIVIPIRDERNRLVSIQGRSIDNEEPKYKFLDGSGDSAKQVLYNLPKAIESAKRKGWLVVVEGCPSVWRLHQYGLDNVVATMSTSVTDRQIELLVKLGLHIVIFFDYDDNNAGQYGVLKTLRKLASRHYENVSYINTKKVSSPDDMTKEEVGRALMYQRKFPFKKGAKQPC